MQLDPHPRCSIRRLRKGVPTSAAVIATCLTLVGVALGCAYVRPPAANFPSYPLALDYEIVDLQTAEIDLDGKPYLRLRHPGAIGSTREVGRPALPQDEVLVVLPPDAADVRVAIDAVDVQTVARDARVEPLQPDLPTRSPQFRQDGLPLEDFLPASPVVVDEDLYASDRPYPAEAATLEGVTTRYGARVAVIRVSPLVFHPRRQLTRMRTSLRGAVRFSSALPVRDLYPELSPAQRSALRKVVANPEVIAPRSLAAPAAPLTAQAHFVVADLRPAKHDAVPYVVITRESLVEPFQPFVEWKTGKGVDARTVTVEWIGSRYPGVDLASKVRSFVLDAVAKWGTSWILLAGDVDQVPARLGFYDGVTSSYGPTDLYYSGFDKDWNANGNHVFGEAGEADLDPDVFVGRAPVRTPAEAEVFVQKVLIYEREPPAGYAERALLAGVRDNLWSDSDKETAIKPLLPTDFAVTTLYDSASPLNPDAVLDRSQFIAQVELGHQIVNHMDHSGIQGMGTGSHAGGGGIDNADADGFANGLPGSVLWTYGCDPNAFDYDAISEHWMRNPNGGTVAFVGNSRTGWTSQRSQDTRFFQSWFTQELRHLGTIFSTTQSTSFGSYQSRSMNLLGDPEMTVWNAEPSPLTLSGLGPFTTGANALSVVLGGLAAGEEATVTFRDTGGEVYAGGETVGGTLSGTLIAHRADPLELVVTSPDRQPLSFPVPVGLSAGPHLFVAGVEVVDAGGNGNQQLEPGESAMLRLTLENGGSVGSTAGTAALSPATVGVTGASSVVLSAVSAGGSASVDFPVSLAQGFSDGEALLFRLKVTGTGSAVTETEVHVPVLSPILEQTHLYDDGAGDGDGVPEAGETVEFALHVINNGFGDAYGVKATLVADTAAVMVGQGVVSVGNVPAKGDADSVDAFVIDLNAGFDPSVDTVTLAMTDSLGNSWTQQVELVVPVPPTGMGYRSTAESITPLWDPAPEASDRSYKVYRSVDAGGPFDKIETFLVRDGAFYEDTSIDSEAASYFYRVGIVDAFGNESAPSEVQAWTSLTSLAGFPRSVLPADKGIVGHTEAVDVDGDGEKEIFAITGGPGVLYAWDASGNELVSGGDPNFAEFAELDGANFGGPAFADLDGDGETEVIVNGKYRVFAFEADGSPVTGWAGGVAIPKPNPCMDAPPSVALTSPAVGDLDGDGRLEVITTAFDWQNYCDGSRGHLYVFRHDGTLLARHHVPSGNYSYATPALADLDGDGDLEAVIPSSTGEIFRLDDAPSSLAEIAAVPGAIFRNEATLTDLDGDGELDVLAASQLDSQHPLPGGDRVFALHLDGSPVAGWAGGRPLSAGDHVIRQWSYSSGIAVADVDCDGRPEVAFGTEQHVYLWEHDGSLKSGWPVERENTMGDVASAASPLIVDVDGDGRLDIVIASSSLVGGGLIYAWDGRTGTPVDAFPVAIDESISRTGALADVDGDGRLEVIQGAGPRLHVFETAGKAFEAFMPWANVHRDIVHTSTLSGTDLRTACCTPPPAGIVAWWPFNETAGSGATDLAGGHEGTRHNGPGPVAGMVGGALTFDGVDSYVTVPHAPAIDVPNGEFTLDFWIRPDPDETRGTIYRKGALGAHDLFLAGNGFHLVYSHGHFLGYLGGVTGFQVDFSPPFTHHAEPGTWTFVALTVDLPGKAARLYIDGELAQNTTLPSGLGSLANGEPVIVGGTDVGASPARSFAGALDEVELFGRVLGLDEIQEIYDAGPAGKCGSVTTSCLGALTLKMGSGDGFCAFHTDETGGIFSCNPGFGASHLDGIRFDPPGSLPPSNLNCGTALYVFDQAGTLRQALGVHGSASNSCPCTSPPAPGGECFYEPLCTPLDVAHVTCSEVASDSGVISISGAPSRRLTEFSLPNFPGLTVQLVQEAFADRLDQIYRFTNASGGTYELRLARVADLDVGYVDDGTQSGAAVPSPDGFTRNLSGFVPFGARVYDNVRTGNAATPQVEVRVTAPQGGSIDAVFEGARLQGDGGSSHGRAWWNYGVPSPELGVYGRDGDYWTVTWSGDPATPAESDQAITVQSVLTVPPGQTRTYATQTYCQ